MKSSNNSGKLLVVCIALVGIVALLRADYYQPNFFPIGLTGLNGTGSGQLDNCPYSNVRDGSLRPLWCWEYNEFYPDQTERKLIFSLGVNCIGCQDAKPDYLVNFDPSPTRTTNDYLDKVCKPLTDPPNYDTVLLITAGYYVMNPGASTAAEGVPCTQASYDDVVYWWPYGNHTASDMFRSPYRYNYPGFGDMQFSAYTGNPNWNCHGAMTDDNWDDFDGDNTQGIWHGVADEAISNFETFFEENHGPLAQYIWGFNLISEEPAVGRNFETPYPWHGCWAAVDRIFTGHHSGKFSLTPASHEGFRGIDFYDGKARMIVAKNSLHGLIRSDYKIFEHLPDIDVFVLYTQPLDAKNNYGAQEIFDSYLYGYAKSYGSDMNGFHHYAVYMQKYGNTSGGPADQERRLIVGLSMEWCFDKDDQDKASARRPCPPEIRCASYLALSRGYKGILFHPWLNNYTGVPALDPSQVTIPCTDYSGSPIDCYNLGLRDQQGYPFGYPGRTQYLNYSAPQAPAWSHAVDNTYSYLKDELIFEIKLIKDVLVRLDWVNAYSLQSTASEWDKDCPLGYVYSVLDSETPSDTFFDLGFFAEQSTGIDYFMVVNREGIAANSNRTITIKLYGWQGISRIDVTDVAANTTQTINRNAEGHFVLPEVFRTFQPGQGKLFKVTLSGGGALPDINLNGEWHEGNHSLGLMNYLDDDGGGIPDPLLGWALLEWRWIIPQPADLDSMKLWAKRHSLGDWYGAMIVENGSAKPGVVKTPQIPNSREHLAPMEDSCMYYVEVGNHESGRNWSEPFGTGTMSNVVRILVPDYDPGGCPDLYSYVYHDTTQPAGYLFVENNTILPHSPHVQAAANDFLKLDALNTEPDHYYMNVLENSTSTSYIDMTKLWAVDHEEETEVATSANDSIYVYSEMAVPTSCTDNSSNDRLGEVLWEDTASFGGTDGSYLTVEFDDPGWTHVGLLVTTGIRGHPQPPDKDFYSVPQDSGASGWDSLGVVFGRLNPYNWVVDVSESEDFTFRITNHGDTAWLDRIALVKLEDTGWTKQVAPLDSAVKWDYDIISGDFITRNSFQRLSAADGTSDTISPSDQLSLSFDKLDTTSFVRTFVLETRGWYSPEQAGGPQFGGKAVIPFGLDIKQLKPFGNISEIRYSVPYKTNVTIAVYDVSGRLVNELVDKESTPGYHNLTWKGEDYTGRRVSAGLYFVRMTADEYKAIRKLVVLR